MMRQFDFRCFSGGLEQHPAKPVSLQGDCISPGLVGDCISPGLVGDCISPGFVGDCISQLDPDQTWSSWLCIYIHSTPTHHRQSPHTPTTLEHSLFGG